MFPERPALSGRSAFQDGSPEPRVAQQDRGPERQLAAGSMNMEEIVYLNRGFGVLPMFSDSRTVIATFPNTQQFIVSMPDTPSPPVLFQDPLSKEHFYITRQARALFRDAGEVSLGLPPDRVTAFREAERLAGVVNQDLKKRFGKRAEPVLPAQLHGMKVLHAVSHAVVSRFAASSRPDMITKVAEAAGEKITPEALQAYMQAFADRFPPDEVFRGGTSAGDFLRDPRNGELVLEESFMVWLNNRNPAFDPFAFLLADRELQEDPGYGSVAEATLGVLKAIGPVGPGAINPAELLTMPLRHSPNSILGQLRYIRVHWGGFLEGSVLWSMLDEGIAMIEDEDNYLFFEKVARREAETHDGGLEREVGVPEYGDPGDAPENYSADASWMPKVVMLAKSTFVWLDQLSRAYRRPVRRLQDIPDRELDAVAERGFTVLWLIGLWERSPASRTIKHMQGNRDAKASAYALDRYDIAEELGGYEGYCNLRTRAAQRGIRLASDMVPNHTGLDAELVREKPGWFVSSQAPPYPSYTYDGPNLSSDPRYGIHIEDGYWDRSDAAVAFKRVDFQTGDTRYIYHGNDGTAMPWNDTAQLNFLDPEVREGVIQQILHVARMFPVIRFDAAMVLAKRHIQRLWYPLPGHAPGIPSRGACAMSMEEFNRAIPEEFWREVVDRIHQDAPDTLLLAEAFWMLEGYFVRTLGMHRVYNSAFMHMLKKEDNAGYRYLIKNTLEYDARILKRYVNFMNNPDEETAVAQFGKGDKYFGVCMVLATMPGLPMFGHGQIEGFSEKYGMEYARALHDERPDDELVARHAREIFPILKKRYLFAEVRHFHLYDVYAGDGTVNENVLAYSNRHGDEKALVAYNNSYGSADGWARLSAGFREEGDIRQTSLCDGLGLAGEEGAFILFRDHVSGLEYIRAAGKFREEGLHISLGGYRYNVFLDFREVRPSRLLPYDVLFRELDGAGVPSIEVAALERALAPLHEAVVSFCGADALGCIAGIEGEQELLAGVSDILQRFLREAASITGSLLETECEDAEEIAAGAADAFRSGLEFAGEIGRERGEPAEEFLKNLGVAGSPEGAFGHLLFVRSALDALFCLLRRNASGKDDPVGDWLLDRPLRKVFGNSDFYGMMPVPEPAGMFWCLLASVPDPGSGLEPEPHLSKRLERIFDGKGAELAGSFLAMEHLHGRRWFRRERFVFLLSWLVLDSFVRSRAAGKAELREEPGCWIEAFETAMERAFLAGYEAGAFLDSALN